MILKPLESIGKEDIDALLANKTTEFKTLEYKQTIPTTSKDDTKEFLADIASFANASGGDILYGISAKDGVPTEAIGLASCNSDATKLRLEQIIRDGLDPRLIPPVQFRFIEGFKSGPILLIRISKSWRAPHMVGPRNSSRFYARNSAGKYPLDCSEIRSAFLLTEAVSEKMHAFIKDRLAKIVSGETPLPLGDASKLVLHLLPASAFASNDVLDARMLHEETNKLPPLGEHYGHSRHLNFDGLLTYSFQQQPDSYCQTYRKGQIETVTTDFLISSSGNNIIPSKIYEKELICAVKTYCDALRSFNIPCPILIVISMLGVKGARMGTSLRRLENIPIDRDALVLPEVSLESYELLQNEGDVAKLLRPAFDAVWNACGYPSSCNYDKDGKWCTES